MQKKQKCIRQAVVVVAALAHKLQCAGLLLVVVVGRTRLKKINFPQNCKTHP
jgi:hypothetical protein